MTTKAKTLIPRGRTTAVKTFTRNNNLSDEERGCRQARTRGNVTNRGCVAWFKQPLSFAFTLVSLSLAILPTIAHAENCPNAVYRTGSSGHLPDCRAYELVSPPEKNGGYINEGSFMTSPEGESVGFSSNSGFAGATSDINTQTGYQSSRSVTGGKPEWSTVSETEPESQFINYHSLLGTDFVDESFGDLSTLEKGEQSLESGVRLWRLQEISAPESSLAFYLTRSDGVNVKVGPAVPSTASELVQSRKNKEVSEEIQVLGMSADASHMVYTDPEPKGPNQWPFSAPGALLEYVGTGNTEPLLVVPHPATEDNGCPQQLLGGAKQFNNIANPISSDGSKIFFTDGGPEPECQGAGELFVRVENAGEGAHTVAISEPTKEDCSTCKIFESVPGKPEFSKRSPAEFLGASEDGSKVFFYTKQPLLNGSGGLYEYDFDAPTGALVTQISSGSLPPLKASNVLGQSIELSPDGSHVYFLSNNVLTTEPSPDAQGLNGAGDPVARAAVAQLGGDNLYLYESDSTYPKGHITFVAALNPTATFETQNAKYDTTPDGRFLVLDVHSALTADDTSSAAQVFEYDSSTGSLVRVSHGEDAYNANGNGVDATVSSAEGRELHFDPSSYYEHLAVSANGEYVYFQSPDALTPDALNMVPVAVIYPEGLPETAYAKNVYEYHSGHVYLISDGQDLASHGESEVRLLGTDLSGRDVFFETTAQLAAQDTDTNKDIYDARVDGGIPAPAAPPGCEGDACQGSLSGAPVLLSPGSESQAGGNPPLSAPAPAVKAKPKALTNAQKLAAALKTCRKAAKKRQAKCEAAARKKYAPAKKKRAN